jgi:hypothetical protein
MVACGGEDGEGRGEGGRRLLEVLIRKVAQLRQTRGSAFALDKEGPTSNAVRSCPKSTTSIIYALHLKVIITKFTISRVYILAPYGLYNQQLKTSLKAHSSSLDAKSHTDPPTRIQQTTLLEDTVIRHS